MSGQINDNIVGAMLVAGDDAVSMGMEATTGPGTEVDASLSLEDRLSKAFTPEGKLRVLLT